MVPAFYGHTNSQQIDLDLTSSCHQATAILSSSWAESWLSAVVTPGGREKHISSYQGKGEQQMAANVHSEVRVVIGHIFRRKPESKTVDFIPITKRPRKRLCLSLQLTTVIWSCEQNASFTKTSKQVVSCCCCFNTKVRPYCYTGR